MDYQIFVSFILIANSLAKHEKYKGYTVYNVVIRDRNDNALLDAVKDDFHLDIWKFGNPTRDAAVMVPPEYQAPFIKAINNKGIEYRIKENILSALGEFEKECNLWNQRRNVAQPHTYYARMAEINAYMERLSREYPDIVTLVTAGQTFEGRSVNYLKISTTNFEDRNKPIYFLDAAMHSREWSAPPVALYTMHRLVEDLRNEDKDLIQNIDWIILPVQNPDGYEFTHTNERMWRKNRSFNASISNCSGVDLNRNYDIFFGESNASQDPCAESFSGRYPFSEIETQIIRDILHAYLDRIQIYMNIHSYGSYVLYGFDNATLPANVARIHQVGASVGAQIDTKKLPEAYHYHVGNSYFVLYPASGTSQDYAQDIGVPFSLTLELPDFQKYGFLVPPKYLPQINEETWMGIAAAARLSVLFYKERIN
ncbi:carboxypeptidase B-like [Pieris rapae]|uniref:carboxypeptidase B-like n=1 Tax=Pieris rapae TaxID=64459 RepID=UPI001E27DD71|nr:carboxypeptidase B-like [Pieris rapae]